MANEEKRKAEDSQFEAISVATLGLVGGAAFFFRQGLGPNLNEAAIKSKVYLSEFSKTWDKYSEDLSLLTKDEVNDTFSRASARYDKLKETGINFDPSNTPALEGLRRYYRTELDQKKILRRFYNSDVRKVALDTIEGLELPDVVKSALVSHLQDIATQSDSPGEIYRKLASRLDMDIMYGYGAQIDTVIDDVQTWIRNNDFENTWLEKKGNRILKEMKEKTFDLDYLLEQQEVKKEALTSKFSHLINPDKNLTIGDILDIAKNGTEDQQKQIKTLFRRSESIFLGTKDGNIDAVADQSEKLAREAGKFLDETRSPDETRVFSIFDIINKKAEGLNEEELKKFRQLEISGLYRNTMGKVYSLADANDVASTVIDGLTNTFPLSMTKIQDLRNIDKFRPFDYTFSAGELSPVLAYHTGSQDLLDETVQHINGRYYIVDKNGVFHEIENLRGAFMASAETGVLKQINSDMNYGEAIEDDTNLSKLERKLGIEITLQDRERKYGHSADIFTNFDIDRINLLKENIELIAGDDTENALRQYNRLELSNQAVKFERFAERNSYGYSMSTIKKIRENLIGETQKTFSHLLDYAIQLEESPEKFEEIMGQLAKVGKNNMTYKNSRLARAIRRYINDPRVVSRSYSSTKRDPYGDKSNNYRSLNYKKELREELYKEFMANYDSEIGYADYDKLLEKTLTGNELREAREIHATRSFLERLGFPFESRNKTGNRVENIPVNISQILDNLKTIAEDNSESGQLLKNQIQEFIERNSIKGVDDMKISVKNQIFYNPSKMIVLNRASGKKEALNIIKSLNEGHIEQAGEQIIDAVPGFFKQFFAGASSPENFTTASIPSYFLLSRPNNDFKAEFNIPFTNKHFSIDLRVKGEGARSTGRLLKTWGLKRILPAMAFYYGFDFADDMSKAETGTGITEAGASGLANVGLGIKKATGFLGLDNALKGFTQDNALFKYWGEPGEKGGEWKTYDEKVEYYRKGYDANRKARYWWFGSSNEFRGGRISYFEPNTLRMLASDYKDMSLYNESYWNKWNPINILDPYYLEKLHSEDRPYPVSGSLFSENTPWGILLNPTLGAIIKPKVYLHSDRLSSDGVDVKALIASVNNQLRNQARENNGLLYVQNGSLKAMDFMAYNSPNYSNKIVSLDTGEETFQVNESGEYNNATDINSNFYDGIIESNKYFAKESKILTLQDRVMIQAAKGNQIAQLASMMSNKNSSLKLIKEENKKILAQAGYDAGQGIMIENRARPDSDSVIDQMINDSEAIAELMHSGSGNDYIHEMVVSARMITGLYGWGISNALDIGQNNQDRIATSADMNSFSRGFWDMNLGGLDFDLVAGVNGGSGSITEIIRRFVPEYRRFQTKNPLMNTMPDWMPERFRFGDPYTLVPKGEARLPGIGYESLNQLHPDLYGNYGAFDRFKILADIAPYSPEYKLWKNIASKTIDDPYLRQEMEEIKDRIKEQNKQHDFQEYKYVDRDVDYRKAYITSIGDHGTFKIFGSDATYKLAGATIKNNPQENKEQVFERYLKPGQLVTIAVDTNEAYARNRDSQKSINAAVVIGDESLAEQMIKNGDATRREGDMSAAATMARHGPIVNKINWLTEAFMHADIPILHNRWFRANTALEDYQDEYLYGSSFQSWDDIYGTFIIPNMRKSANSAFWTATGILSDIVRNNLYADTKNNLLTDAVKKVIKKDGSLKQFYDLSRIVKSKKGTGLITSIQNISDRGALMGYLTGKVVTLGKSNNKTLAMTKFRRAGIAINLAFSGLAAPENLAVGVMSWSRLGYMIANEHFGGSKYRALAAGIGAVIGITRWGFSDSDTYIPDSAKKRWELQDYFDRLTYLKYMGLYEKAAELAKDEEDIDIKAILEKQKDEYNDIKDAKETIKSAIRSIKYSNIANSEEIKKYLTYRLNSLEPSKVPLGTGEYAKSAVMYYRAAQATMYAMNENSSMANVVRALPKTDREYFMEFIKERDEEKRKEILKYVSPQIRKALRKFWYKEIDKPESNESFFQRHALPAPTWDGWNPQIDLADVQAKVVKNEGMMASDFGIYSSQYRDEKVINAPDLNYRDTDSYIEASAKIKSVLSGLGISDSEVSIEPTSTGTLDVIANVVRIVDYKLENSITSIFDSI